MNSRTQSLLVGLVAGLASALLIMGSGDFSALSILLSACATLPILIAGLGWSNLAGAVSVATATGIVAATVSPLGAVMIAVTTLAPAAWIAHLSNLARPAEELGGPQGKLAWYPLSGIMLHLCGLVSLSLIILGVVIGYGEDTIRPFVDSFIDIMGEQNPEFEPDDASKNEMTAFMTRVLPAAQSAIWVMILFAGWYVACGIVRVSGRAKRPTDIIPADLRMTRPALFVFGAGLALGFIGGAAGLIGSVICGAFAGGFMLAGLAMLHHRLSGSSWRGLALWFTYTMIVVLFPLPLLVFLFGGMFGTARTAPPSSSGPGPSNSNNQSN